MAVRYRYRIISWPAKGKSYRNLGVYSNDLNIMVYFADKWAKERAVPHMVIEGTSIVHHAFAPHPKRHLYVTPAELSARRTS
jgi:hypothetical protein